MDQQIAFGVEQQEQDSVKLPLLPSTPTEKSTVSSVRMMETYGGKYSGPPIAREGLDVVKFSGKNCETNEQVDIHFFPNVTTAVEDDVATSIEIIQQIQSPYLFPTLDVFVEDDRHLFLVYPPRPSATIVDLTQKLPSCFPPWCREMAIKPIIQQITAGLIDLHQQGLSYCYLTPHDIYLGPTVTMGGISKKHLERDGGDLTYCSPEHVKTINTASTESDIWALGMITFFFLFEGKSLYHYMFGSENSNDNIMAFLRDHRSVELYPDTSTGKLMSLAALCEEKGYTQAVADFINACLRKPKAERIRAEGIMYHPFMLQRASDPPCVVHSPNRLKKSARGPGDRMIDSAIQDNVGGYIPKKPLCPWREPGGTAAFAVSVNTPALLLSPRAQGKTKAPFDQSGLNGLHSSIVQPGFPSPIELPMPSMPSRWTKSPRKTFSRSGSLSARSPLSNSARSNVDNSNPPTSSFQTQGSQQQEGVLFAHRDSHGITRLLENKGKILAGFENGVFKIHNTPNLAQHNKVGAHECKLFDLDVVGNRIYTCGDDVKVWLCGTLHRINKISAHKGGVFALAGIGTSLLATGGHDCVIRIWELNSTSSNITNIAELVGDKMGEVTVLKTQVDNGKGLVFSADRQFARVFDLEANGRRLWAKEHSSQVLSLVESGIHFYSGCLNGEIRMWDMRQQSRVLKSTQSFSNVHAGGVRSMYLDDLTLVTGGADHVIKIWDTRNMGQEVVVLPEAHKGAITSLLLSGPHLYSGSTDGSIKTWQFAGVKR